MVRTQIQLTEEQATTLRELALERRVSVAELIRNSIDSFLRREGSMARKQKIARAKAVAGLFSSGISDTSEDHDRYLAEAFEDQ